MAKTEIQELGNSVVSTIKGHISDVLLDIQKDFATRDAERAKEMSALREELAVLKSSKAVVPEKGADGVGFTEAFINKDNELVHVLTNGETKNLGVVVGSNGTSVDPDEVAGLVDKAVEAAVEKFKLVLDEAVSEIEVPKPEKSLTIDDIQPSIDEAVSKAVADIPPAKDGDSVTAEELVPIVAYHVDKAVSSLPTAKDGDSVTVEQLLPVVEKTVSKAVSELPKPKDGESVTIEDVQPVLEKMVEKAVEALPKPENGDSVTVEDVAPLIESEIVKAITALPKPKKGKDGLGFDDMTLEMADEKTIRLVFERGSERKEKTFAIPAMIYRGVYSEAKEYTAGDMVTWGGSLWHCNEKTGLAPKEDNAAWTLAAKKGRDGKSIKGDKGDPGKPGKNGADKTQNLPYGN